MVSPKLLVHFLTVVLKDLGKKLKGNLVELMKQPTEEKGTFGCVNKTFGKKGSLHGRHRNLSLSDIEINS